MKALLFALLIASSAHAEPCASERVEAEREPAVAEDVAAYQRCLRQAAARVEASPADKLRESLRGQAAAAARERQKASRDLVILGSVFVGLGGAGVIAVGATGGVIETRDHPVGVTIFASAGTIAAAMTITGAILIGVGKHQQARQRALTR